MIPPPPAPAGPTDDHVRAFVALLPGPDAAVAVRQCVRSLAARVPPGSVRWTRHDQLHLTLRFLGQIPAAAIPTLTDCLSRNLTCLAACDLALGLPGGFPSSQAPRVLWIGLTGDLAALHRIERGVAAACAGFGDAPSGSDRFQPHLTLGRVAPRGPASPRQLAGLLTDAPTPPPAGWRATEVLLYQSRLTPEGAVHSVLARFPLGEGGVQ